MIATIARFVGLVLSGVFAGFLVGVLVLELSMRDFGGTVYAQVRQVELARLDDLASATLLPALATTAVVTVWTARPRRDTTFWLTAVALVLLASVLVLTLAVNLPINTDQLGWDVAAPPGDWADVRDRWQVAHAIRTTAAVLAFGCLSGAALLHTQRDPDRSGPLIPRKGLAR